MDAYLSSRNGLALKYSGAATRACGIPLPSFSKRKQPLHSPQTTFFRAVAIFFRAVAGALFSIASMRLSARGCSFLSGHVPFLLPVCPRPPVRRLARPPLDGTVHPHGALPQHIARIAAIEPARNPDERRSFALHAERLRQRRVHVCVDEQNALWHRAGTQAASRANVDLPGDPCPRRRPAFPGPLAFAQIVGFRADDVDRLRPRRRIPASPAIASMRLRPQATTSPGKARSGRHIPASRVEIGIPGTVDMHYNNSTSMETFESLRSHSRSTATEPTPASAAVTTSARSAHRRAMPTTGSDFERMRATSASSAPPRHKSRLIAASRPKRIRRPTAWPKT